MLRVALSAMEGTPFIPKDTPPISRCKHFYPEYWPAILRYHSCQTSMEPITYLIRPEESLSPLNRLMKLSPAIQSSDCSCVSNRCQGADYFGMDLNYSNVFDTTTVMQVKQSDHFL